jgi:dihydrofolate reductase
MQGWLPAKEWIMKLSVFVGTSLDGFIARRNGDYDFLPADGGEPHGYEEFMASVDTILIGRNTLDVVLKLPSWPYAEKRVVVLSHRPIALSGIAGRVEQMSGAPEEIVARLAATGSKHVYVDGGITVQEFLRAGLIDRLTITRVPVLIGDGIPLFGTVPRDIKLRHVGTRQYESGLVTSEYEVAR